MTTSTLRLGTSAYSYWHFTPEKTPLEMVLNEEAWAQAVAQKAEGRRQRPAVGILQPLSTAILASVFWLLPSAFWLLASIYKSLESVRR